ncbi:reverse transcriptase domain-containing protein [Tanacetum coccineum]
MKSFYKKTGRTLQFDAKEPVGFDKTKVKCYNCHKTGHFARECRTKGNQDNWRRDAWNSRNKDWRRSSKQEDSKALVTIDEEGVDWTSHSEEREDYALMACNNSGSDTEYWLGYGDHRYDGILSYENEVLQSVFMNKESELENQPLYDKFVTARGMHVVPPPMTGNYMPSGPDVEIDYSQFTYGPKQSQTSESETQTSNFDTCESDCSVETNEPLPEPTVNKHKVVCQPKVWSDAPIIEEYKSDSEDEHVSQSTEEQKTPSFANQQVKTPRETVKNQFKHSKNPTVDKKVLGYGFIIKSCFVCGSLSHLIRDCDFHEKRMAKQSELNNRMSKKSSQREIRPIWNNVNTTKVNAVSAVGGKRETAVKPSAGDSEKDAESAQDFFVLPIWSSYYSIVQRSTAKDADELERLKRQEQDANDAAEAIRMEFAQETKDLLLQAGAAKPSSTNILNTASTPVSTASPYGGLSFTDPTNPDQDDSEIPALEDIYKNSDILITSIHPSTLILGDPKSAVQTRSKVTKSSGAHAFIQKVWILVDLPYGKKAIGTKWVYKNKKDERRVVVRNKVRLVAQGHRQEEGIDYDEDKYVVEILKKFDFISVKTASTPIETQKPLVKDEEASDVDVHLYRSMIGSLMYLTALADIMYLKGKPRPGEWKSTTGGCQFLGRRLISWQCKKQTIMATSTTEAEYVAAANCCGQVLWIQNQMHHFIRDAYEKKLIQVLKIHINDNVADLLTKAFDVNRESLGRALDGTEALLLPKLFILWLAKFSTDGAKLIPLGKDSTAIETLKKIPPRCMRTRSQSRNLDRQQQQAPPAFVEPFNLEEPIENPAPPVVTMDDNRTMAQLLEAPTEGYEDAIVVPEITADNFELKHGLLTLVQNKQFFGHDKEDPHAHIRYFNKITSTMKFPNVPSTSFEHSTPGISPDVVELKDMVKALLLDKKSQALTPVKAVEEKYVSQAAAANYNPGNTSYRALIANQIRSPDMISKFVNANTASSSGTGSLPSNTITNPKEDLKGITTQSGVAYQGPTILTITSLKVVERETEVTKDTMPPTNNKNTKDVQPLVVQDQPHLSNSEPVVIPVSAPVANLKPTIPYPLRRNDERRRQKANDQIEKFYKIFKDLSFEISLTDALILMPKFASTLKALIGNKEKLSEMARTLLNEHCSAVILNKLPEKLRDPKKFLIPCDFPGMDECLALADFGASINLMPLSVWKRLSLPKLTPTFVDFDADPRVSLILRRSFLKTERALIDVYKGELTLRVGKEAVTFNLDQTSRYSSNYDEMTANRIEVIEMACEEYSQEVKRQEKDAIDAAEALKKEFAQETENLLLQAGAAKASSPNIWLIHKFRTCCEMSVLIPTSRRFTLFITSLYSGDPQLAVQTRSKVTKSSGAHAFYPKYPKKVLQSSESCSCLHKLPEPDEFYREPHFFLGLQVKQKEDGIFISQDKYVAEILKKFDFVSVKTASTPIETQKPLVKDEEASDVDVHLYRSMIGSLMYLTAFRPDIMFAVCACSRFQVTPKTSHLNAIKRIFRYLKGKPKLGLWYPKVSSFDLEAYSDSDYAWSKNLDRLIQTGDWQNMCMLLIVVGKFVCAEAFLTISDEFQEVNWVYKSHWEEIKMRQTEGNARVFIEVIDFSARCSIHNALTLIAGKPMSISEASIRSDLLFDDADGIDSLPNQAIFDAIRLMGYKGDLTGKHFSRKVTPLFASMLVQPTEDEGTTSERPSEPQPTPSPPHPILVGIMEVIRSSWEIKHLKRRGEGWGGWAPPEDTNQESFQEESQTCHYTPQSLDEECILKAKVGRKENLKGKLDAKGVYAQDVGMTREVVNEEKETVDVVNEEKETVEKEVSTEDVLSTAQQKIEEMRAVHCGKKKQCSFRYKFAAQRSKTFEEIQALYEKVKRFDESFTAVGSIEDERRIKEMNEGVKDPDHRV